jgi:hypothetical protein
LRIGVVGALAVAAGGGGGWWWWWRLVAVAVNRHHLSSLSIEERVKRLRVATATATATQQIGEEVAGGSARG